MQHSLVPIAQATIGPEKVNTVNARDLHRALEIGKDFSTWIKMQIDRAGLDEHVDYSKLTQKGELSKTGQWVMEYTLTLDAAKHIAMMSQSRMGKRVRDYFIEVEKRYRAAQETARTATTIYTIVDEGALAVREAIFYAHEGVCFYTKRALAKDNFALDHVQPVSAGGKSCFANLVPVSPALNSAKGAATHPAHTEALQLIARHYAPLALALFTRSSSDLVAPGINPSALLSPGVMQQIARMYGSEAAKSLYARVIPAIGYEPDARMGAESVDGFIEGCINKTGGDAFVSTETLYTAYLRWCELNQQPAEPLRAMTRALERFGARKTLRRLEDSRRRGFAGVEVAI